MPYEISWYMCLCEFPVPEMRFITVVAFGGPALMSNIIAATVRGARAAVVISALLAAGGSAAAPSGASMPQPAAVSATRIGTTAAGAESLGVTGSGMRPLLVVEGDGRGHLAGQQCFGDILRPAA